MELWSAACEEKGEESFAEWVVKLVCQGEQPRQFAVMVDEGSSKSRDVSFIQRDAVMTLYELLKPYQIASHIDQQGFLDLLQQTAETMNLQPLSNQDLDDWVPVEVVHRWVKRFISAHARLFRELGLDA